MVLKVPDGLSHYMTVLGVADAFPYWAEWNESWTISVLIVLAAIALEGCSTAGSDCGVADDVSIVDEANVSGQAYYLVARISGSHDKVVFFELYGQEPLFDQCGRSAAEPISMEPYDGSQGYLKRLTLKDKQLEIVYTSNEQEAIDFLEAKIPRE
jgi:hypothetical protein